jgi:thiamine kinase-like enzyme
MEAYARGEKFWEEPDDQYIVTINGGLYVLEEWMTEGSHISPEDATEKHHYETGKMAALIQNAVRDFWPRHHSPAQGPIDIFSSVGSYLQSFTNELKTLESADLYGPDNRMLQIIKERQSELEDVIGRNLDAFAENYPLSSEKMSDVHGDMHLNNLLFSETIKITGLIDFGLAGPGVPSEEHFAMAVYRDGMKLTVDLNPDTFNARLKGYAEHLEGGLSEQQKVAIWEMIRLKLCANLCYLMRGKANEPNIFNTELWASLWSEQLEALKKFGEEPFVYDGQKILRQEMRTSLSERRASLQMVLKAAPVVEERIGIGKMVNVSDLSLSQSTSDMLARELTDFAWRIDEKEATKKAYLKKYAYWQDVLGRLKDRFFISLLVNPDGELEGAVVTRKENIRSDWSQELVMLVANGNGKGTFMLDSCLKRIVRNSAVQKIFWNSSIDAIRFYEGYLSRRGIEGVSDFDNFILGPSELDILRRYFARRDLLLEQARAVDAKFESQMTVRLEIILWNILVAVRLPPQNLLQLLYDEAHGFEHGLATAELALELAQAEAGDGKRVSSTAVALGALFHDIEALGRDRRNHHRLGAATAKLVLEMLQLNLEQADLKAIVHAVFFHRSHSDDLRMRHLVSALVRDADTLDESLHVGRVVQSGFSFGTPFFRLNGLTLAEGLEFLRTDTNISEVVRNKGDQLQVLLRAVTVCLDPRNYVTQAARAYFAKHPLLETNRAQILAFADQYAHDQLGTISGIVEQVIREYPGTRGEMRDNFAEIADQYRVQLAATIAEPNAGIVEFVPLQEAEDLSRIDHFERTLRAIPGMTDQFSADHILKMFQFHSQTQTAHVRLETGHYLTVYRIPGAADQSSGYFLYRISDDEFESGDFIGYGPWYPGTGLPGEPGGTIAVGFNILQPEESKQSLRVPFHSMEIYDLQRRCLFRLFHPPQMILNARNEFFYPPGSFGPHADVISYLKHGIYPASDEMLTKALLAELPAGARNRFLNAIFYLRRGYYPPSAKDLADEYLVRMLEDKDATLSDEEVRVLLERCKQDPMWIFPLNRTEMRNERRISDHGSLIPERALRPKIQEPRSRIRFAASLARRCAMGQTPDQVLKSLRGRMSRWMTGHRAFILKNKTAIVDALMALEQGIRENELAVPAVLKKFGLRLDSGLDLDLRGFARKVADVFKEANANLEDADRLLNGDNEAADSSTEFSEEDIGMTHRIFDAIAAVNQATIIRYEMSQNMFDPDNRSEQIRLLLEAVRNSVLINPRFSFQLVADDFVQEKQLRSELMKLKRAWQNEQVLNRIQITNRADVAGAFGTFRKPAIRITDEVIAQLVQDAMLLNAREYADGKRIDYSGARNLGVHAEMLAVGLAAVSLDQKTAEMLVTNGNRVELRSEAARRGVFMLLANYLGQQASQAAFSAAA